jgi:ABC-type phosphate transport system substrate-binding protein
MLLVVVLGVTTMSALVGAHPAHAAGARTLTVTPATALGDQVALVQWAGFDPTAGFSNQVIVLQCKANPQKIDADHNATTADDCLTATPFPNAGNEVTNGVTQADGTGSAFIEILPAAQQPALNCSQTNTCTIVAYENNGTPPPLDALPTTAIVAPLTFAKSVDDCPPVTNYDLRAEGEASAAQLVYSWAANLCTANPKLILDYTDTSSVSGREDFLSRLVDIGATSMPPTAAELAAAPKHPAYTYAPLDVSADVVVYNMIDPTTGQRIRDLTLSPRLVARAIADTELTGNQSDRTSFFGDPELKALNPHDSWPSSGLAPPLLRAERSADTYITTDWIAHDANAEAFLQGHDKFHIAVNDGYKDIDYPTDIFENHDAGDNAYVPLQGELPVVRKVFYGVKPAENPPTATKLFGFIGIVDYQIAQRYQLPMAKIVKAAGQAVAPTPASLAAGFAAMKTNPDGITKYPDFAATNPAIYPLTKVDYAMVPTSVSSPTFATNLKNLLTYVAGPGQSSLPDGYLPMPSSLTAQDTTAIAKIKVATTSTPTTTPTTSPPSSPVGNSVVPLGNDGTSFNDGPISSNDSTSPNPTTPTTSKPATTPKKSHHKSSIASPVVAIADTGERYGLPIFTALALLAGLYPLGRRGRPYVRRGWTATRARLHPPGKDPAQLSASGEPTPVSAGS